MGPVSVALEGSNPHLEVQAVGQLQRMIREPTLGTLDRMGGCSRIHAPKSGAGCPGPVWSRVSGPSPRHAESSDALWQALSLNVGDTMLQGKSRKMALHSRDHGGNRSTGPTPTNGKGTHPG